MKIKRIAAFLVCLVLFLTCACEKTTGRLAGRLPKVSGAKFETYYDAGDGCDEVIYGEATSEIYADYVEKLQSQGYKVFSESDYGDSHFKRLFNEKYTVNVGYYANESKIRAIIENKTDASLFGGEEDNKYETVTTAEITMIGLCFEQSDGKMSNTGACLLIRLCDGRFVVFDGGHVREAEMINIVKEIRARSKDYADKVDGIKIAAWVITHPHSDHWGALTRYYSKLRDNDITVESVIYNFLSESEAKKYEKEMEETAFDLTVMPKVAKALGAKTVVPHVGNVYHIANMKMEIMFTIESYAPNMLNDMNGLSLIARLTFTDPKTGEETVFMTVGDATGYDFRAAAGTFGDFMKADICQIAHHGASTKGDNAGTIMGYDKIRPATVLWTSGQGAYNGYAGKDFNNYVINKRTNPNFKEVYVAGMSGTTTTLTLPYKPGEAKVVRNNF